MLSYTFYLGTFKKKIGLAWQARFITVEKRAHFHFWNKYFSRCWVRSSCEPVGVFSWKLAFNLWIFEYGMSFSWSFWWFTTEPQKSLWEVRPLRGSHVILWVLYTTRIENVKSVLWGGRIKEVRNFELGNELTKQIDHRAVQSIESSVYELIISLNFPQ